MADPVNSVKLKMTYTNTDFTRDMTIGDVAESVLADVETKIQDINDSLASGTAGGLENFFIADDYVAGASATIGAFNKISEAVITSVTETPIDLS